MKILLVTNMFPSENRPDYGVFVKEQMDAVSRRFPEVDYELYYIDNTNGNKAYLRSVIDINRKISGGRYDLVHIHYGLSGLFLLWPFRRWKVPVVVTLHGGDIQPEQGKTVQVALTNRILRHADAAISLNDRMTALAGRRCSNVAKIACSVDTEIFAPSESRRYSAADGTVRLLFPSNPARKVKNYPLFEAVVAKLEHKYGLKADTVCVMNMTRSEVAQAMRDSDLMLMTSISEGSPQAVKEAMACNLPVVSTKVGDVDMLLDSVGRCVCSASDDPEALADHVFAALGDESCTGMTGREKIFALGLDHDSVAARIFDIYLSLINRP